MVVHSRVQKQRQPSKIWKSGTDGTLSNLLGLMCIACCFYAWRMV